MIVLTKSDYEVLLDLIVNTTTWRTRYALSDGSAVIEPIRHYEILKITQGGQTLVIEMDIGHTRDQALVILGEIRSSIVREEMEVCLTEQTQETL